MRNKANVEKIGFELFKAWDFRIIFLYFDY